LNNDRKEVQITLQRAIEDSKGMITFKP